MEEFANFSRFGDRLLRVLTAIVILLVILFGAYSFYDNWLIDNSGFESGLMKYKPSSNQTSRLSFEELIAINPDVVAWITIDGTHVDYPVVQGKNDLEYLNKDPLGKFSLSGSLFLSCLNASDFSDAYSLIYGHHMNAGGMFGDITEYLDKHYFKSHKQGTLYLRDGGQRKFEIFSVLKTSTGDFKAYSIENWTTDNDGLKNYLESESLYWENPNFSVTDDILGLSTCYDAETNGRVIVFGKLVRQEVKESE